VRIKTAWTDRILTKKGRCESVVTFFSNRAFGSANSFNLESLDNKKPPEGGFSRSENDYCCLALRRAAAAANKPRPTNASEAGSGTLDCWLDVS